MDAERRRHVQQMCDEFLRLLETMPTTTRAEPGTDARILESLIRRYPEEARRILSLVDEGDGGGESGSEVPTDHP